MRLRYQSTIPLLPAALVAASALAAGLCFYFLRSQDATGEDVIMATVIEKSAAAADHDLSKEENSERVEFRCEVKDGTTILSLLAEGDTVRGPDVRRANIGSYIGLLQDQQRVRNQGLLVAQLRKALAQFEAIYNAERIDYLQVQHVRSNLYREQCALLDLKTTYDSKLDAFKIQLGLPPHSKVKIEDEMIGSFSLIDEALDEPQNRLSTLQSQVGRAMKAILNEIPEGAGEFKWSKALAKRLTNLKQLVAEAEEVRGSIASTNLARAKGDVAKLASKLEQRVKTLDTLREKVEQAAENGELPQVEITMLDSDRFKQRPVELNKLLDALQRQFDRLKSPLDQSATTIDDLIANGSEMTPKDFHKKLQREFSIIPHQMGDLSALTLELKLIQTQARAQSVDQGLWTMARNSGLKFELCRQLVLVAIDEVLFARFRLQEPPQPDLQFGAVQQLGATSARDVVSALNNLKNAQNDFVNLWVKYETLRRTAPETESKR